MTTSGGWWPTPARALGDVQPRYLLPGGFRKSRVLYNLHRAAAEPGQTGIVGGRVPGLRFRRIVLMLDGDAAGRKATRELGARLGRAAQVYTAHLPEGSQPDKASDWEINFFCNSSGGLPLSIREGTVWRRRWLEMALARY